MRNGILLANWMTIDGAGSSCEIFIRGIIHLIYLVFDFIKGNRSESNFGPLKKKKNPGGNDNIS